MTVTIPSHPCSLTDNFHPLAIILSGDGETTEHPCTPSSVSATPVRFLFGGICSYNRPVGIKSVTFSRHYFLLPPNPLFFRVQMILLCFLIADKSELH